jgi:hypothetical protein
MITEKDYVTRGGILLTVSKDELKNMAASNYEEGTIIDCGKYSIEIIYGPYKNPALKSRILNINTGKAIGCTPGVDRPYFLDEFLHR